MPVSLPFVHDAVFADQEGPSAGPSSVERRRRRAATGVVDAIVVLRGHGPASPAELIAVMSERRRPRESARVGRLDVHRGERGRPCVLGLTLVMPARRYRRGIGQGRTAAAAIPVHHAGVSQPAPEDGDSAGTGMCNTPDGLEGPNAPLNRA